MIKWLRNAKIDAELNQILADAQRTRDHAHQIREFLLQVIQDDIDGREKYSDEILATASDLIDELGPGAFYFMAEIAGQMAKLAQCSMNGTPTNVDHELGKDATLEEIVKCVVVI